MDELKDRMGYSQGKGNKWFKDIIDRHVRSESLSICDYGCGEAPFYAALTEVQGKRISRYLGVDINKQALARAHKHIAEGQGKNRQIIEDWNVCSVKEVDMERYAKRFDIVIMHHLIHDIEPLEALPQVFQLLKPGGKILIGDICGFVTYHGGGVPFNCKTLNLLFDSRYFDVSCDEYDYTIGEEISRALSSVVIARGDGLHLIRHDIPCQLKALYVGLLDGCREKRKTYKGKHLDFDGLPDDLKYAQSIELTIADRLQRLHSAPDMLIKTVVEKLIKNIKQGYPAWSAKINFTPQEGTLSDKNPVNHLEVSWLRKKQRAQFGDAPEHENTSFETFRSGPLLDALESPENAKVVLLGDPGIGKSTAVEFLMYEYASRFDENGTVPILVRLKLYKGKKWLEKEIMDLLGGISLGELVKNYNILLLLDGFNEVSNKKASSLEGEIAKLLKTGCRAIITSRKFNYPTFNDFTTCEIEPLSNKKIREYIGKTFNIEDVKEIDRRFNAIENKGILNISRVPLFLHFICERLAEDLVLPESRGELLEQLVRDRLSGHEERLSGIFTVPSTPST